MKKLLALVLAVMMLGTVALAADVTIGAAGTTDGEEVVFAEPGKKIVIKASAFEDKNGDEIDDEVPFTSEYFAITTKKFDKGAALVKSVAFNDKDECIEIKLVEDDDLYTDIDDIEVSGSDVTYTGTINLIIKELGIKSKKKYEDKDDNVLLSKNTPYTYEGVTDFVIGYLYAELSEYNGENVLINDSRAFNICPGQFDSVYAYNEGAEIAKNGDKKVDYITFKAKQAKGDSAVWTDLEITFCTDDNYDEDIAYAEGRLYKNDVVSVSFDMDPDLALVKEYSDAELTFLNMKGELSGKISLEVYADEDEYLYEVVDGKLVATSLKWDDDTYAFTGKVSALGNYVISDTKLDVASASTSVANPDTGANDVVGIAVALAAVAAVSAAAVSLKK